MLDRSRRVFLFGFAAISIWAIAVPTLAQPPFPRDGQIVEKARGFGDDELKRLVIAAGATRFDLNDRDRQETSFRVRFGKRWAVLEYSRDEALMTLRFSYRQGGAVTKTSRKILKKWKKNNGDGATASVLEFSGENGPETLWLLERELKVSGDAPDESVTGSTGDFAFDIERFVAHIEGRDQVTPEVPDAVPGEIWIPTEAGVFRVIFPDGAEGITSTFDTPDGEVKEVRLWYDDPPARLSYRLTQMTFPATSVAGVDPAREFPGIRDDMALIYEGKAVDGRALKVGAHPGYQFSIRRTADPPSIVAHVRLVWAGNTLFKLSVYGRVADAPAGSINKFLESLQTVAVDPEKDG